MSMASALPAEAHWFLHNQSISTFGHGHHPAGMKPLDSTPRKSPMEYEALPAGHS